MRSFNSLLIYAMAGLALTANAAVAPRASSTPGRVSHRPPFTCPPTGPSSVKLSLSDEYLLTQRLTCTYGPRTTCSYSTVSGTPLTTTSGCTATATATSGCLFECDVSDTEGNALSQVEIGTSGVLICLYSGVSGCRYGTDGAIKPDVSTDRCPAPAAYQCGNTPARRSYRGADNFTAWLSRRNARRAGGSADPAAPAPAPALPAPPRYQ